MPTGNREAERKLNNIDKSVQEILMSGENLLKIEKGLLFTEELKNLRAERQYWKKLRKAILGVTHKELRKSWEGHKNKN